MLHIVFLRDALLLTKKHYLSWREIQDAFDDYMTSLGPWSAEDVTSFFEIDYGQDDASWPLSRQDIADLIASDRDELISAE